MVVVEGLEFNLSATLEKSQDPNTYIFTCSPHQVTCCTNAQTHTHTHSQHIMANSNSEADPNVCVCVCVLAQFQYQVKQLEYSAPIFLRRGSLRVDSTPSLRRKPKPLACSSQSLLPHTAVRVCVCLYPVQLHYTTYGQFLLHDNTLCVCVSSEAVRLLRGPVRLQPVQGGSTGVRLCVVCGGGGPQLCVQPLLQLRPHSDLPPTTDHAGNAHNTTCARSTQLCASRALELNGSYRVCVSRCCR